MEHITSVHTTLKDDCCFWVPTVYVLRWLHPAHPNVFDSEMLGFSWASFLNNFQNKQKSKTLGPKHFQVWVHGFKDFDIPYVVHILWKVYIHIDSIVKHLQHQIIHAIQSSQKCKTPSTFLSIPIDRHMALETEDRHFYCIESSNWRCNNPVHHVKTAQ